MSVKSTGIPSQVNNRAEGSPDDREELEPPNRLRTSTIVAIRDTDELVKGDTGVNLVVKLNAEGQDDDDSQDAYLTTGETKQVRPDKNSFRKMPMDTPILIVEDTVELGEVIQATLEGMGLESFHETHGKTGLERMRVINPKIVILDIGLPDMTGWKILDGIKEYYASINTTMPTIIVITAYGDPANRLIGKLQNIHSYLIKPFTPDQVEKVVGMALRGEKPDDPMFGISANA